MGEFAYEAKKVSDAAAAATRDEVVDPVAGYFGERVEQAAEAVPGATQTGADEVLGSAGRKVARGAG
ncbi:MAG: hypothetical protein ABEK42_05495, partial [Thiohalorhabdaceae bacterium]